MGILDYVELDKPAGDTSAAYRYPVRTRGGAGVRRGPAQPFAPRFTVGEQSFTGGTPPFSVQGQRLWQGFQLKYARNDERQAGFRTSHDVDVQYHDRVMLSNSFNATVFDTAQSDIRFAGPFQGYFYAYATGAHKIWYKSAGGAWTECSYSGMTGTPSGWVSACIGAISGTPYLLFGSKDGHFARATTTTVTQIAKHAGLAGGVYTIVNYNNIVHLGGATSGGVAVIGTCDSAGTTFTPLFSADTLNGAARVNCGLRRYVDSDNTPNQLHFVVVDVTAGNRGWHYMYDGTSLRELKFWADYAPQCMVEMDVTGARALFFGMNANGSVWRYTGDYAEVLRIDTPDVPYTVGVKQLAQFGKFLVCPLQDATNGASVLYYDGDGWWQGSAAGSSYTGEACGIGVYRDKVFLAHAEASHSRIFELENTTALYQASGAITTSLFDAGWRETPKIWLRARLTHKALRTGESMALSYALDDTGVLTSGTSSGAYAEDFSNSSFKDAANTTALWDTTNRQLTVTGVAAKTYVGKLTASLVVNKNLAYSVVDASPTSKSPGTLIAAATEFAQGDYDNVEADDAGAVSTVTTVRTTDVNQTSGSDLVSMPSSGIVGQSLLAGANGSLTQVDVKVRVYADDLPGPNVTITARLYATSAGLPVGSSLSTATGTASGTDTADHVVSLTFGTPYTIASGTTYALVFSSGGEGNSPQMTYDSAAPLSGGSLLAYATGAWGAAVGDLYLKTYVSGTTGKPCQIYQFDFSSTPVASLASIPIRFIGYGADSTGAANGGVTLYVWNANSNLWVSQGTHATLAAGTDAAKTITATLSSSLANYIDGSNKLHLLLVPTFAGTSSLASKVVSDFIRMDGSYSTAQLTGRSLDVDSVVSGNIATATLTATTNGVGSYSYYMSVDGGGTWEAVTSGVQKTFAGTGNALRWRADLTGASATSPAAITALTITYTLPGSGVTVGWTALGTNSIVGSTESVFDFADAVYSKVIAARTTLAGPGTSSPQLFSVQFEYLISPDVREVFACELNLQESYTYSDDIDEAKTPAEMYATLLGFMQAKRRFSLVWVDGTTKTYVTFYSIGESYQQKGVPSEETDEEARILPIRLITVKD